MPLLLDILVVVQAVVIFLFAGYEYLTLWDFPALPPNTDSSSDPPMVSIILPVRNQARTVVECLGSLVSLDYPNKEVIVVEGHSTDGTQDLLRKYQGQVKVVGEEPLPPGWVGKNWACHLGYKQAQGELLLFTDGDSIHSPASLKRTVSYLQSANADMVTLAPGAILKTFWEKLLQPPIFLLIVLFVGGKWVNDDTRKNSLGNGQYMLFRRGAYEKVGGHEKVRERIVEDYTLARLVKLAGLRLRIVTAQNALGVRMYSSLREVWRGWRKNFYEVSDNHKLTRAILRLLLLFSFLVLPFVVLGYGIFLLPSTPFNLYLFAGAFMSGLLWLGVLIFYRAVSVSRLYGLLFPLAIMIYIGIGLDSTIRGALGLGVPWKGRVYRRQIENPVGSRIA
ncbi:MAG TPA: glycosyltransferase family 2 protein [Candidatus Bathyarchaeia archaeon]